MSAHLYLEGATIGRDSKESQIRCREGFRKLIEKAGFAGRMPRLTACGGRTNTFDDFRTAHTQKQAADYIGMLVDSEEPPADGERTWDHLKWRDNWDKPEGAEDEQVVLMITCMETWIVADREALQKHYGHRLQESALPPSENLESRGRDEVHAKLVHATRDCSKAYSKGKRSFEVLSSLNPAKLSSLTGFARMVRILEKKL